MPEVGCKLRPQPAVLRASGTLRALAGLALLGAALWRVDRVSLLARLSQLQVGYVVLGALLSLPQLGLLALRWRIAARSLGQPLPPREALRDYALGLVLNQLLPLGVLGDGVRVLRQAGRAQRELPAWSGALHGVLLERGLGQLVLLLWALSVLPLWLGERGVWLGLGLGALALASLYALRGAPPAAAARAGWRGQLSSLGGALGQLAREGRGLGIILGASALILLSIAVQLYCALWSLGLTVSPLTAAKVFPLLLLSMSVPLSFAGFGPREAAVAGLYGALSLSRSDGLAFSVAYGSLALCSSVPCACVALWLARGRRAP